MKVDPFVSVAAAGDHQAIQCIDAAHRDQNGNEKTACETNALPGLFEPFLCVFGFENLAVCRQELQPCTIFEVDALI